MYKYINKVNRYYLNTNNDFLNISLSIVFDCIDKEIEGLKDN